MFPEMLTMLARMSKRRLLCLSTIPILFLITAFVLNSHLLSGTDGPNGNGKSRLVASRRVTGSNRLTFRSDKLKTTDEVDKVYDVEKLMMLGLVNNKQDEVARDNGKNQHSFNELISSRLSLNRAIPDTRHQLCSSDVYQKNLPNASVVICFYNEAWSTLLRTVHSVINRSPPQYLYEIVLVDDASTLSHLQERLADYLWSLHPNIKLVRLPDRQGLIRARMYGANVATGQVLVFLDSHCEVNIRWMEPLLARVANNPHTVAIPVIDMINPDSFEYKASPLVKGGFNWGLHFSWEKIDPDYFVSNQSYIEPIKTATMAGGLFAIQRQYYRDMGEYDPGMDTWGGENLEMSFRIWQCGGKLEIVPCSRVGHIFRKSRPYGGIGGEDSMLRNSVRVAKVWMDDYIQHFFQTISAAASVKYGNITDRLELRKKLDCKPFQWYLKYIYPELAVPGETAPKGIVRVEKYKPKVIKQGAIQHVSSGMCMTSEGDMPTKDARLILTNCHTNDKYQEWSETDESELMLLSKLCVDLSDHGGHVTYAKLMKCTGAKGPQAWIWSIKNMVYQLYNPTSGKCLVPVQGKESMLLTLEICSNNKQSMFKMVQR